MFHLDVRNKAEVNFHNSVAKLFGKVNTLFQRMIQHQPVLQCAVSLTPAQHVSGSTVKCTLQVTRAAKVMTSLRTINLHKSGLI